MATMIDEANEIVCAHGTAGYAGRTFVKVADLSRLQGAT